MSHEKNYKPFPEQILKEVVRENPGKAPKTTGIKIRGTGAAIKGTKARGPMG